MREKLAKIRLVISDMDGTLLDRDHQIPDRTLRAIAALEKSGRAKFAIGTGRARSSASLLFPESFGFLSRPGIFLNGTQTHGPGGDVIHTKVLGAFALEAILNRIDRFFPEILSIIICTGDECIAYPEMSAFSLYLAARYLDPHPQPMKESLAVIGEKANMISIVLKHPARDAVWLWEILSEVSNELNLKVTRSLFNLISVMPPETSKASGVTALAKSLGLDLSEVAVIGDAHNDLEMLKCAGLAVAVGNAIPELLDVAHWIVNSHDDPTLPGVAQLIESILTA